MSTARASPSATPLAAPAGASCPPSPARWPAATPATGWRRCASAVARAWPRSSSESDCRRPGTDSRVPPVGRDAGLAPSLIPRHDKESHGYRTQAMTDEQRKSVALEYLKGFDNAGTTSTGGSIQDLFADDAQVMFPKWGLATGKDQIGQLFTDVGSTLSSIPHHKRSSPGSTPAPTWSSWRAPATVSTRTAPGGPSSPNGVRVVGATSSRSGTSSSSAASSTWIPTTPAGTPPAIPGCHRND